MTDDQKTKLKLMLSQLAAFENGAMALDTLIPELEGLFSATALADADWREGFRDSWGDLEISYAFALDMGWKSLDEESEKLVSDAVAKLKTLVVEKLQKV
ncbi:hypothetical protein CCR94_01050 [Rhodoblastus sphagnicola]|uniref:Uncharacterized protein n=1 Tax=Rhodoblastus sphagnicola TaxID=333368 RepID=A0A2S6NG70_9HYPH|nr:hypothetical protein [Rhodoblastus sphagnicola]MBB4200700.1 hypothetical protein [Rhodoblastus sphagnicola]PPQ33628.1 hypothetical protein CCR94_01050 [Rhodoblastus sphagnicola]